MKHIEPVVLHECVDFREERLHRFGMLLILRRVDHCARRKQFGSASHTAGIQDNAGRTHVMVYLVANAVVEVLMGV